MNAHTKRAAAGARRTVSRVQQAVLINVQMACASGADLPSAAKLRRWARHALRDVRPLASGRSRQLTLRVVDIDEMTDLNQRYRGKRGPTNVLSFCGDDPNVDDDGYLGDLVLCAPVVMREAEEQIKPGDAHWAHLVLHGVLHLRGHDHERAAQARVMETLESEMMTALGFDDPWAAERGAA